MGVGAVSNIPQNSIIQRSASQGEEHAAGVSEQARSFKEVLASERNRLESPSIVTEMLEMAAAWRVGQSELRGLSQTAPKAFRSLLRAQNLTHHLGMQVQLLSSGLHSVQQGIRQLQQAGGS